MTALETVSRHACFGGEVAFHRHQSAVTGTAMRFATFVPPQAAHGPVPAVTYLAGLTCTEETFMTKAGALAHAARLGLMLVAPDTSPRGAGVPGEADAWDLGLGAGFYLDATEAPWAPAYRMESYVTQELRALVAAHFPVRADAQGLMGHSMGGHGALTLALRHPRLWRSVSAFAPIAAPMHCPWGHKAFAAYLGPDRARWAGHDASALMAAAGDRREERAILVDQGLADQFLASQLHPERFEAACAAVGQTLVLRRHPGYDHGYYFIQSFVADHLAHHAAALAE
jgi:S-formylglutathione hydrolase